MGTPGINEKRKGICALASLRTYQEVFRQLYREPMHVAVESLQENIDRITEGLRSADASRPRIENDVPKTLLLPTVWSLLRHVLEHLLTNAVAAAQQAGGWVTISGMVEATSEMRCCHMCVVNQGRLSDDMRTTILQRRPVLKPNGEYGTGLLAAGEVLTVLGGYLSYPRTATGTVRAIAVLRLKGG